MDQAHISAKLSQINWDMILNEYKKFCEKRGDPLTEADEVIWKTGFGSAVSFIYSMRTQVDLDVFDAAVKRLFEDYVKYFELKI